MTKRTFWTDDEVAQVKALYADMPTQDLAKRLGRSDRAVYQAALKFGLKKSAQYMQTQKPGRFDGIRGGASRFTKGQAAWNKGIKGLDLSGGKGQFTTGHMPTNHRPVGSTRLDKDGYQMIKTAEPNKWELLHRVVWKEAHGSYPPKGKAIVFKDGDKLNCVPGNLEMISRIDLMKRNSVHNLPKELAELVQLRGALNRQINKRSGK
jgi:hypothetical protein